MNKDKFGKPVMIFLGVAAIACGGYFISVDPAASAIFIMLGVATFDLGYYPHHLLP